MEHHNVVADIYRHERDFFAGFAAEHLIHHAEPFINLLVSRRFVRVIDVGKNEKFVPVFERANALFYSRNGFCGLFAAINGYPFQFFDGVIRPSCGEPSHYRAESFPFAHTHGESVVYVQIPDRLIRRELVENPRSQDLGNVRDRGRKPFAVEMTAKIYDGSVDGFSDEFARGLFSFEFRQKAD